VDIAILGAGIAGLGAALKARETGREAVLFEARTSAGGLLDNFTIDGYRFDLSVHLSFATEPKVRSIFDRTPYYTHPADAGCYEHPHWLKHPVQNNLFPLPAPDKVELIRSFLRRPEVLAGDDYESWLRHQYGDAIAERYPIRYTRKYWGIEPSRLSTNWVGNRMRRAELEEILFGAFTPDTPNTYYTKEMRYPKVGGYKAFINTLIQDSTIHLEHEATAIDPSARRVTFANGRTVTYEKLVSTLPLPVLVQVLDAVPGEVAAASRRLRTTSVDLVSVGFRSDLVKSLWFYIYDEDILASRANSPSVKSPDNVPPGRSSLQFEIYSPGAGPRHATDRLLANTRLALERMGIAGEADIAFMDHRFLPFGNVVFERGMEAHRAVVQEYLAAQGISSCGRFGAWDYFWSNQSFMSGYGANLEPD
jgi:protoporphyrinogen oxidase